MAKAPAVIPSKLISLENEETGDMLVINLDDIYVSDFQLINKHTDKVLARVSREVVKVIKANMG